MNSKFEVFVLTFNRAELLELTLRSLLAQTYSDFQITILDNGSTDETQSVVKRMIAENPNRKIIFKTVDKNQGSAFNFQRAQIMASAEFAMLCHDDDIYHPKYFETILPFFNHQKINLISCQPIPTTTPETEKWQELPCQYYELDKADLALHCLLFDSFCFPATFYRTSVLKEIGNMSKEYGKIADRAVILKMINNKKAILLKGKYILYRLHSGSDSNNTSTGPFLNEVLNLLTLYKESIYQKNNLLQKVLYHLVIYNKVLSFYNWSLKELPFSEVLHESQKRQILSSVDVFFSCHLKTISKKIRKLLRKFFILKLRKNWQNN